MEKFILVAVFVVITFALILSYERPSRNRKKITGRGGDFAE